ncbi:MAG: Heterosigma akashiwo virus 01 [Bacteroidota bacterium]
MLTLKKRGNCCELPLLLYDDGIRKVKYRLLELHPEFECIIKHVYLGFLVRKELTLREKKSLIVESAPKSKLMTLKDKKILSDPVTLTMNWYKILGAELTLREKDCKVFWNKQCAENSKKLWFPTEIGCADSPLNLSNGSLPKTIQNSWFSIKQSINLEAKNLPLFKYSPVEKWENEGIRTLKIKLLPTQKQKQVLEKWSNTSRYVYNKCLAKIKEDPSLNSSTGYKKLNKECITKKDNNIIKDGVKHNFDKFIYDWELETPKDIRNGGLRDIKKAYKTAFSNLKAGNINHFGLEFRKKKNMNEQSMKVPASAIKIAKSINKIKGFTFYTEYLPSMIKVDKRSLKNIKIDKLIALERLTHDTRLKRENNEWFLCISYDVTGEETTMVEKTCALDPGTRKFQVIYSEDKVISISTKECTNLGKGKCTCKEKCTSKIKKIYATLDKFKSLRDNKKIKQRTYDKKRCRTQAKLNRLVDEMHFKTISYLTKNYTSILLPSFETQEMVGKKSLHRTTKRDMMNFAFYKFKQRLIHKCALLKHCNVTIVNEAYTSQTCGYCGNLKKTSAEVIQCDSCHKIFDRDVNGSRNIYIKYTKKC